MVMAKVGMSLNTFVFPGVPVPNRARAIQNRDRAFHPSFAGSSSPSLYSPPFSIPTHFIPSPQNNSTNNSQISVPQPSHIPVPSSSTPPSFITVREVINNIPVTRIVMNPDYVARFRNFVPLPQAIPRFGVPGESAFGLTEIPRSLIPVPVIAPVIPPVATLKVLVGRPATPRFGLSGTAAGRVLQIPPMKKARISVALSPSNYLIYARRRQLGTTSLQLPPNASQKVEPLPPVGLKPVPEVPAEAVCPKARRVRVRIPAPEVQLSKALGKTVNAPRRDGRQHMKHKKEFKTRRGSKLVQVYPKQLVAVAAAVELVEVVPVVESVAVNNELQLVDAVSEDESVDNIVKEVLLVAEKKSKEKAPLRRSARIASQTVRRSARLANLK
ncbi:hypothetical protein BCR33DRAFT_852576 [Rhizoclosmatium globosum]|uniref:Uncharacterized protein n=1 Tax=Rhizoclosmatium globosum TaxID=329046 RepID=A0A1Y2C0W2_9FUNG|nr:hypothetical protein BCR33DRAFT_852576 [Rhizoclosmatium globosum]|eukprot:ORY40668.1 hypothetical protein BCR33DRAFT_852576 [Rhizoclosmatium globosum]